jgi:putative colanic acid biosynthesis UDP-glucose lipid carrier transferase
MLPKGLLKEYSQILAIILRALDVSAVALAGVLAFLYKFGHLHVPLRYAVAMLIAGLLTLGVFQFFRIYESVRAQGVWQHIGRLIQALLTVLLMMAGLAFITKTGEGFSREWFSWWALFAILLLVLFRFVLMLFLRFMRAHGLNEKRVVVIGAGELGEKLIETVQHAMWTGFRIVTIFDDNVSDKTICGMTVQQTPENISAYLALQKESIDEVWLALPLRCENRVKEILHELRHDMVNTRFVLDIFGMDLVNHSITDLAGFPVLNIRSTPMVGTNRFVKAIEDRVLASIILLLLSPLLVVLAIAVKISSPGPVFYRQKRVGWNGKEFEMLKFRSMPTDAEDKTGPVWAKAGEQRATKIGAFLRKTSLDELPQFINVLKGDMSIVGPRPERLVFVEQFKDQIPRYMQKHLVKAGITGWAQVNGWRGNTSLEKRIEYDLYYIEHWSFMFDLKIIFLTIFQGFINKNAY